MARKEIIMFYLIETQDVGPNEKDSRGHWKGDTRTMQIHTEPGRTNMSHEIKTSGWLGTTNDWYSAAHGEFDTLEAARAEAHRRGFTAENPLSDDDQHWDDEMNPVIVEVWITPEAARDQWDAGDWFINGLGCDGTRTEYGITAMTTDDELDVIIEKAEAEARAENIELHGTEKLFKSLRDELIADAEDED